MTHLLSPITLAAWMTLGVLGVTPAVQAQVAGSSTTLQTQVTPSTEVAMGWSVKKTLLGKAVYNDAGAKVGKIEDLIIAPERNVSFVILGAGGFVGIGRHDVAIPVGQIQDRGGRLILPGASKDSLKALPTFTYVSDTRLRDQFLAQADKDIAEAKASLQDLEKKASTAATEAKARMDVQASALRDDIQSAETRLAEMRQATAVHWRDFEASVNAATLRLRKSIDKAVG
ncbi:PRC-barrel domain-containing protein [Curvibacter sp. RS43]|jgi:sporulation protein YlmC with PRC-barrel domain|uniref:PRC-barrel domain-containing protein n=1 Tax=Curvibacter microcysteis TaxID=3026419 RepID=A0ABT5MHD6_9BURK|nr:MULTISPECIES: PRC-barrel domain-containing protein [unclassified Curvibacter]MDD0812497.1 PRC-barrel domain-containing protein [Curvibacter sp. RS43]MDD0815994.1 PRC-barrel domain-containing protein [Curvibacter sp. HBC28]